MAPVAISLSTGDVILIVVFAAIPVALLSFVLGAGDALRQIGKGQFAVQFDSDLPRGMSDDDVSTSPQAREAELRQLLEAKAYRQLTRGERPIDVDAELTKLLAQPSAASHGADPQLVEEVRQLVIARNERRLRRSEEPLDVDLEVERQLRELDSLGQ
jgi:hypothetical protein